MKLSRSIIALACALFISPALAQSNQGASPLTGAKGGTNNGFMQFTGPAGSMKTYTLPNASGTIDLLNAVQTITAAKTFNDLTLLLAGSSSGTTTLKASAVASGTLTLPAATGRLTYDGDNLGAFSATTSAQLAGVLSDETGSGKAVFAISPTLSGVTLSDLTASRFVATDASKKTASLTSAQATAMLDVAVGDTGTGGTKGLVPAPGAGDAAAGKYLRADSTWGVPSGGGGGSASDSDRQNTSLLAIYQSKWLASSRRLVNLFATGFKGANAAANGINTGASSGYVVNSTDGYVTRSVDAYSTEVSTALNENSANWSGWTIRIILPPGAAASGDRLRLTFTPPTAGANTVISDVFLAHPGSGSAFDGTQARVQFSGNNGVTLTAGGAVVPSDLVTYAYDSTKSLMIAIRVTSGDLRRNVGLASTYKYYSKSGSSATDASDTNPSGFGAVTNGRSDVVSLVEARTTTGSAGITLTTIAQQTDSSVSNSRVLLQFDNAASATLNSDITAKVRCDGASAWTAATLSDVTLYGQGGQRVVETADTACAAGGTSFEALIETFNSKNIPIYGASVLVH